MRGCSFICKGSPISRVLEGCSPSKKYLPLPLIKGKGIKGTGLITNLKFIVDNNVGKLAKWLRMMGYDTLFFNGSNDSRMVATALNEGRVILTRDTQIMERRVVTSGRLKAILIKSDKPESQMRQVINDLKLDCQFRPFAICLECNQPLLERSKQQVAGRVPPYVFQTQSQYMECPICHRIYWRGTHWQRMTGKLKKFEEYQRKENSDGRI